MKKNCSTRETLKPRRQTLPLADLVPHPDQEKYFRGYGAFEYEALKADIEATGLRSPIEVMPPGNAAGLDPYTILAGHTRRRVLIELGRETAEVLVRYDLADATRADVDRHFLLDNVARRQQDRLGQARAAVGLFLIEKEQKGRRVHGDPLRQGELRDRIGLIVNMSGRNLHRYLNILGSPIEVQDAFENGRVKLVDAARVASLSKQDQERLAARLRSGEDPKAVFAAVFAPNDGKHVKPADAVAAFARAVVKAHADLGDRVELVRPHPVRAHEQALRAGEQLIGRLLGKLDGPAGTDPTPELPRAEGTNGTRSSMRKRGG